MECDSVHATIERQIRDKDIYVPFEFVKYTQEARKEPFPYEVRYLSHNFFLNYDSIQFYDSIRPGRIAGDPVVTDIHCLRYNVNGHITFKFSFDDPNYSELPRRPQALKKGLVLKQLYSNRLPIPETKWKHLQELKSVIPPDYHGFYDNIPYCKTSKKIEKNYKKSEEKESKKARADSQSSRN